MIKINENVFIYPSAYAYKCKTLTTPKQGRVKDIKWNLALIEFDDRSVEWIDLKLISSKKHA